MNTLQVQLKISLSEELKDLLESKAAMKQIDRAVKVDDVHEYFKKL